MAEKNKKKDKKIKEPEYIMSALNTPMLNYRVYYMSKQEKIVNSIAILGIGGIIGLCFYGGLFKDAEGNATSATMISNLIVFSVVGLIALKLFLPIRTEQLRKKRLKLLTHQFRSFLEAVAVSLSSGMNMTEALYSADTDLRTQFSDDAYIVAETREMLVGIQNNIQIEDILESLGERSDIGDIKNFAVVFRISYRAGGNLKEIVKRTNSIISERMEIAEEIETVISSNKTQFSAMMVIPVVMMLLLRFMSSSFAASFATTPGVIAITIAIAIFVAAYRLGQKIMNVKD